MPEQSGTPSLNAKLLDFQLYPSGFGNYTTVFKNGTGLENLKHMFPRKKKSSDLKKYAVTLKR